MLLVPVVFVGEDVGDSREALLDPLDMESDLGGFEIGLEGSFEDTFFNKLEKDVPVLARFAGCWVEDANDEGADADKCLFLESGDSWEDEKKYRMSNRVSWTLNIQKQTTEQTHNNGTASGLPRGTGDKTIRQCCGMNNHTVIVRFPDHGELTFVGWFTFTALLHFCFTSFTLDMMAASFGVPAQTLCFSIDPTRFPRPDSFTMALVTGRLLMLERRNNNKSMPPV